MLHMFIKCVSIVYFYILFLLYLIIIIIIFTQCVTRICLYKYTQTNKQIVFVCANQVT